MKIYNKYLFLLVMGSSHFVSASSLRMAKELIIAAISRCKNHPKVEQANQIMESAYKQADVVRQIVIEKYAELSAESTQATVKSIENAAEKSLPVMQGAKTDAVQSTSAKLWAKSTIETTNNYYTTNNYAKKTFAESCFEWLKNGGQKRAFCAGVGAGGSVMYFVKKEQVVVVQVPVAALPIK